MLQRTISALLLLPLIVFIYIGGLPLFLIESVVIVCALNEFYKAFEIKDFRCIKIISYTFPIFLIFKNWTYLNLHASMGFIFILFLIGIIYVLNQKYSLMDLIITFLGIFYVAISFDCIILTLYNINGGSLYVWLIFICAFGTDICAYFGGYFFGKHKLNPTISPKKTVEGSVVGIIGCVLCCLIYGNVLQLNPYLILFIGIFGSIIAQIGDLFASSIKRFVGIKDFGNLIPGHGGMLDRFDSILLVAPFIYYSLYFYNVLFL